MVFTEKQKKIIGSLLIGTGILMILPGPGDAFTNLPLGEIISNYTGYSRVISIILTYTLIPITLIYIGAFIHPSLHPGNILHRTRGKVTRHFTSFFNRLKKEREFQLATLVLLLIIYKLFQFYQTGRHITLGGL